MESNSWPIMILNQLAWKWLLKTQRKAFRIRRQIQRGQLTIWNKEDRVWKDKYRIQEDILRTFSNQTRHVAQRLWS